MKKIILILTTVILLAGCASIVPAIKTDWSGVNAADLAGLQGGKISLETAAVLEAAADVLKAEGWKIDAAASDASSVTTVRRHGVTVYGSIDYAMSCRVVSEDNSSKLSWSIISFVSQFITNVDPVGFDSAHKWNISVYRKLAEKGLVVLDKKTEKVSEPAVTQTAVPAISGAPDAKDDGLPVPPKEE